MGALCQRVSPTSVYATVLGPPPRDFKISVGIIIGLAFPQTEAVIILVLA
jgi:hypothetical protein